jgi:DNA-binding PadR family transcriptional regulator
LGKVPGRLIQPAILAVLAEETLHGYLIVQRLEKMAIFRAQAPDATGVYRLLKAMEKRGLVTSTLELADKGAAKRRFELTPQGKTCLKQWANAIEEHNRDVAQLLTTIQRVSAADGKMRGRGAGRAAAPARVAGTASAQPRKGKPGGLPAPFIVEGAPLDVLDLKVLLLTQGVGVHDGVYKTFGPTHRISADPYECGTLILPGKTPVHLANLGPTAPFQLTVGPAQQLQLRYRDALVTDVTLPKATAFYRQRTARGTPFRGLAVLQGLDVLVFPYLWPCDYAKAGQACRFCHCGNFTQQQWAAGVRQDPGITAQDVAEVVDFAVNVEKSARYVQLTGGSTFNTEGEIDRLVEMLRAIDRVAGLKNVKGEVLIYTTPPSDPRQVDKLFAAGADRVACDLELWDQRLVRQVCPGKTKWTGRQRHLDALLHVAQTQGPGKACSTFVVGLEPAESFLAGAEHLAAHGVVPIPSIWMAYGLPAVQATVRTDLAFFRKVRRGLAEIYEKYRTQPPGREGFNVCLCRDTWNHRAAILAGG